MNKVIALTALALFGSAVLAFAGLAIDNPPEWVMMFTRFYFSLKG